MLKITWELVAHLAVGAEASSSVARDLINLTQSHRRCKHRPKQENQDPGMQSAERLDCCMKIAYCSGLSAIIIDPSDCIY